MDTWEWIVLGVAIAVGLVLVLAFVRIRWRRTHLKTRFGPEYHRAVADDADQRQRGWAGGQPGRAQSQ